MPVEAPLKKLAEQNGVKGDTLEELVHDKKIQSAVLKELQGAGRAGGLAGIEIIDGVVLADEEWTAANVSSLFSVPPRERRRRGALTVDTGPGHGGAEAAAQGDIEEVPEGGGCGLRRVWIGASRCIGQWASRKRCTATATKLSISGMPSEADGVSTSMMFVDTLLTVPCHTRVIHVNGEIRFGGRTSFNLRTKDAVRTIVTFQKSLSGQRTSLAGLFRYNPHGSIQAPACRCFVRHKAASSIGVVVMLIIHDNRAFALLYSHIPTM